MEQLVVAGYIPFTNVQISFTAFAVIASVASAAWFYHSLEVNLRHPVHSDVPPTSLDA